MDTIWICFGYYYGLGGLLMGLSFWVLFEQKALNWDQPHDKKLVLRLAGATFAFLTLHALWISRVLSEGGDL